MNEIKKSHTPMVIAGVEIPVDEHGRFNLNALHRASNTSATKRPSIWLATKEAKALTDELTNQLNAEICQSQEYGSGAKTTTCLNVINGGNRPGTYAHELLAVSYAGWINAKFQLLVNRVFIDYKTGRLQPPDVDDPAMLMARGLQAAQTLIEEKTQQLAIAQATIEQQAPKVQALERIALSDGEMCVTDAAKHLQVRPKDAFDYMMQHGWIYRRVGGKGWLAYQHRIQQGLLCHKVITVERPDGSTKVVENLKVTPKGLVKLAEALGVPHNPQQQLVQ